MYSLKLNEKIKERFISKGFYIIEEEKYTEKMFDPTKTRHYDKRDKIYQTTPDFSSSLPTQKRAARGVTVSPGFDRN
jgi:hypothetical protein